MNKEVPLSVLTRQVCVDLVSAGKILKPTEQFWSDQLPGEWFQAQTGLRLPDLAEKLQLTQEKMLVYGDPENHLLIFRSSNQLKQVVIKYGQKWSRGKANWFPTVLGLSGITEKRLVGFVWQLKDSSSDQLTWLAGGGAVSLEAKVAEVSVEINDSVAEKLNLPWFTQAMIKQVEHSQALVVREGYFGSGIVLSDQSAAATAGFSIIRQSDFDVVQSKVPDRSWQIKIDKSLTRA